MGVLEFWQRYRAKRTFRNAVSPKVLAKLAEDPKLRPMEARRRHFQFIVVHVEESNTDEIPKVIGKVVSAFCRHRATLSGIASSFMVAYLGMTVPTEDNADARATLVREILAENGERVRIVHGECTGLVGLFGSEGRWTYDAIIPGFSDILKKLLASDFGSQIAL